MEGTVKEQEKDSVLVVIDEIEQERRVTKSYNLFFSLYFLQGIILSIGITMPYLYPELPSYKTLSLFNAIDLPFAFKFLVSPFLQKYTNFGYGKRKTWIVISQFICFTILLAASSFTQFSLASILAVLLMVTEFFITIQDISLDSLSIKEIKCPEKTSIVQSVAQNFGKVAGSLFLLKFTSSEFAGKIGLTQAVTTPGVMIGCIATLLLITCTIIHFCFKETALECQEKGKQKSLCEIVSLSATFLNIKSKYCRFALFLLVNYQGLNFYEAGYDYEMVKAGFSRDTSNTLSNCISVIVLLLSFKITPIISKYGTVCCLKTAFFLQICVYIFNILVFSQSLIVFLITQFMSQLLITTNTMTLYMFIYKFPIHGFTGMFATLMLSIWNFSQLTALNSLIIHNLGWKGCALFGIFIQLIFVYKIQNFLHWIQEGTIDLQPNTNDEQQDNLTPQIRQLSTYVNSNESI